VLLDGQLLNWSFNINLTQIRLSCAFVLCTDIIFQCYLEFLRVSTMSKSKQQQPISAAGESSHSTIVVDESQTDKPNSDDDRVSVDIDELNYLKNSWLLIR
jgi:hypothetical protein